MRELQLREIVLAAENATEFVRSPEFKRVVFDRILEHLLRDEVKDSPRVDGTDGPEKMLSTKGSGPIAYLMELVNEGLFEEPKSTSEIIRALGERGHTLSGSDLTWQLNSLTKRKEIGRA